MGGVANNKAALGLAMLAGVMLWSFPSIARAEPFGFDDIRFWVGSGQNQAALVVYWSDANLCLVWGYRFDGTTTGQQMLEAIAQGERRSGPNGPVIGSIAGADPRLGLQVAELGSGPVVFGLGYDVDDDGPFQYVNGASETGHAADPDDVYHEGWFTGFWNYRTSTDGQNWTSAETGLRDRVLADGDWDAWVWDPTFSAILDPPGIDPTGFTPAQPPGAAPELHWSASSGEWSEALWFDGTGFVSPQGGEAMLVDAGTVEVDGDCTGPLAADSLQITNAKVDILSTSRLEVDGAVNAGPGAELTVDGILTAGELAVEAGDSASGTPGGKLSGSGTIHASDVLIGGVLAPGRSGLEVLGPGSGERWDTERLAAASLRAVPEPGGTMQLAVAVAMAVACWAFPRFWRRRAGQGRRKLRGFTLIELLVVIAVISILMGLTVTGVQKVREAGRRTACSNNLRQIGLALHHYQSSHQEFPMGCLECRFGSARPGKPMRMISWNVALLPLIEQENVYRLFNYEYPAKSEQNRQAASRVIPTFLCPSTPRRQYTTGDINGDGTWQPGEDMAFTDYGGIYGVEGPGRNAPFGSPHYLNDKSLGIMLYEEPTPVSEVRDGLAYTVIVGECSGRGYQQQAEWANGHNCFAQHENVGINQSFDNELHSDHPGGAQVVFADGHVEMLSEQIDQQLLVGLLTRAGGEPVNER